MGFLEMLGLYKLKESSYSPTRNCKSKERTYYYITNWNIFNLFNILKPENGLYLSKTAFRNTSGDWNKGLAFPDFTSATHTLSLLPPSSSCFTRFFSWLGLSKQNYSYKHNKLTLILVILLGLVECWRLNACHQLTLLRNKNIN